MYRFALAGAVSAALVAVVLGGTLLLSGQLAVRPSPTPFPSVNGSASPSPSPVSSPAAYSGPPIPALTQTVTSSSGDLTIRYPADWTEHARSQQEPGGTIGGELPAGQGEPPTAFFVGWSVPLPEGQSAAAWLAAKAESCGPSGPRADIQIGGHAGRLLADGCSILGHRLHYAAATVVNGRGYSFHMDSRTFSVDEAWFEALLANVSIQP
jgi:hypothetical protein